MMLNNAILSKASDVHLMAGLPPTMRIDGEIEVMKYEILSPGLIKELVYQKLSEDQIRKFEARKELNASFSIPGSSFFRINVYYRAGNVEAAIRILNLKIPSLKELGLPPVVGELTRKPNGLILITGPAGMGKTTTMASMVDLINRVERRSRIIMIEDPVEYVHQSINAYVIQRELGKDTESFNEGLKQALRQDPNWICIGEARDLDTISTALTAAETGHLVLATLHSKDSIVTIDRILNIFPREQQELVRMQLASVLEGIISQRLLPRIDRQGRVLAVEVLMATAAVRNVIRSGDIKRLGSILETSSADQMISLDQSLMTLYRQGVLDYDVALANAKDDRTFKATRQFT